MKFFKKVTATLIAVSMSLAMTISSFAWTNESGYYTMAVKVEDAEGKAQTTFAPGSDVYFAVYLHQTADPSATENIAANSGANLVFNLMMDANALDAKYTTGSEVDLNSDTTTGYNIVMAYDNIAYFVGMPTATNGFTVSNTKPIAKYKLTLGNTEMDNVDVTIYDVSAGDGNKAATGIKAESYTFSIKKAAVSEKPSNGDVIGETGGKKIYYANTVTGTFNKNTGFKVKYTGSDPAYTGKYKDNCKDIEATLGDLLSGEIGEGGVIGNLHFGIVLKDKLLEATTIPGFNVETN